MRSFKRILFVFVSIVLTNTLLAQPWDPGDAGVSEETTDYINTMQYLEYVLDDPSFQNCLGALIHSETVPDDAIELTRVEDFASMESGKTYVIRGDFNITTEIKIPSRCTVYVDGHIHRDGNYNGGTHGENSEYVIFRILSKQQVNLIGVNNARLTGNKKVTAVYVDKSHYVTVQGFHIENVWEGLVARGSNTYVTFKNNYIFTTGKRAIWFITSQYCEAVHNFCDMPRYDGVDFDAYSKDNVAFENVVVGAGRWAGFVEEAAARNRFIRNVGIMKNNPGGWQMGWADNGTTVGVYNQSGQLTRDNYFVENVMVEPAEFTNKQGGGDYFAKANTVDGVLLKGMTYFWANRGYGCGKGSRMDNAEWLDELPNEGADWIDELDARHNSASSVIEHANASPQTFALLYNYPNPFNSATLIQFTLEENDHVDLSIYNTVGQKVANLIHEQKAAGAHVVRFSADGLPSGVYICTLQTSRGMRTRKMLFTK